MCNVFHLGKANEKDQEKDKRKSFGRLDNLAIVQRYIKAVHKCCCLHHHVCWSTVSEPLN